MENSLPSFFNIFRLLPVTRFPWIKEKCYVNEKLIFFYQLPTFKNLLTIFKIDCPLITYIFFSFLCYLILIVLIQAAIFLRFRAKPILDTKLELIFLISFI